MSLQTSRGVWTSLQTCNARGWLSKVHLHGFLINYLFGDLVAFPTVNSRASALRNLLGLDPGHQGADTPGLLLAILDRNFLAGLPAELLTIDLGDLDTPQLRDIGAFLAGEATALTL